MVIIDNETIKNLNISMSEYYRWAIDVFKCKEKCQLPPKISMKKDNHVFFNVMPSIVDDLNAAGVKVVSRFPKRIPALDSQILLYDSITGENLALMDGNIITAYRTGAIASLAINTLAIKKFETIAFIGLGNIAHATMNVFINTLNGRKIIVKLFKYFNEFKETHELSEVLKEESLGRNNNKQRIIAYNIGNSIFDIYFAKKIYDCVIKKGNVNEIDLKSPKEKYWV